MFNKFLVIASKQDLAGSNITTQLSQFRKNPLLTTVSKGKRGFDFHLVEDSILYQENLNLEKINEYDFVIFASKHSSEKKEKTLSVHAPGNFREAYAGGFSNKLCKSSALFQKQLFQRLKKNTNEHDLRGYKITLECTHHGPFINKPCVFIEIGSTETEWKDRRAGFIIAKTISDTIEKFRENPYNEIAIGIGGPHYCPGFNKLQLKSNLAFSHIIPQYVSPITANMIKEAWNQTTEEPDFVVLDWKGIKGEEQRKKLIETLEKNYIPWKKRKDIKR